MLMGKSLFQGEDLTETLASVVKDQPDLGAVPVQVRRLLDACLQKDPRKRLQSIGDMRLLLDAPRAEIASPKHRWIWPAVAALAVAGALAQGFVHFREAPPEATSMHLSVPLQNIAALGFMALSPDGRRVAAQYRRAEDPQGFLWVRALDASEWTRLDSTGGAPRAPFWSPDSRFIGFFQLAESAEDRASRREFRSVGLATRTLPN
jgi:eukaryotic-like serine/threonine-protein kinase